MTSNNGYNIDIPADQKDFLYSVLNLPNSASQNEIRERHRALSLIFHPDKQQDERAKDTAAEKFLQIQKAYEVLSDPFLREVYDLFGEEGLSARWPDAWRFKPTDELRVLLKQAGRATRQEQLESLVRPRGHFTCTVDASPIFERHDPPLKWHEEVQRLKDVGISTISIGNSIQTGLGKRTKLTLSADMASLRRRSEKGSIITGTLMGTIRHQYSPRWTFQMTDSLLKPQNVTLRSTYGDDDTQFVVENHISLLRLFPPSMMLSLSRRLFRKSLTQGILTFHTEPMSVLSVSLLSPKPFDLTAESYIPLQDSMDMTSRPPNPGSVSGLGVGSRFSKYSVILAGLASCLRAEWGFTFSEIAVHAKFSIEYGFIGLAGLLTGSWSSSRNEVAASVGLSHEGVIMRLEVCYLGQRLTLPIVMSHDKDAALAFCTAVLPTTAFVVGYHLIFKPRRRAQRIAYFQAAQRELEEQKSASKRAAEETTLLLKDTARKHTKLETSIGGLVVVEATYGPTELVEEVRNLFVDVTVAVQALVHNSQVHVPGLRTKSGIQGFYDPAPSVAKSLRVRYLFRGRTHYAEIPDYIPVVLPLADHLVQ